MNGLFSLMRPDLNAYIQSRLFCLLILFSVIGVLPLSAQFTDWERIHPYQQIFVKTDNFDTSYLSILQNELPNAPNDSIRLAMLNDLAYYWHTRNLNTAARWTDKGLELATKSNSKYWEGKLQISQAAILLRAEALDSAEMILHQAKEKVQKKDWPHLYTQLSYVMERRGLLGQAADHALTALQIGEELEDTRAIAQAYSDLSYLFYKQSKFDKALEYGLKSEALFRKRGIQDMDFGFTLYILGEYYRATNAYEKAMSYFDESIAIGKRYGFYNNLSDAYIAVTELQSQLGNYPEAETAGREALKYAELLQNNAFMTMRSWLALGKLQNLQGQFNIAIKSLTTCLKIATENFGDEFHLHQAYQELGKAHAANGNYKLAYSAFAKYDQLKDSIFTAASDERIAQLQTEFEVQQKEATIASQKEAIRQQRNVQLLVASIAFLLLLILVGLYRNYTHNKIINEELATLNADLETKNNQLDVRNEQNELLLKEIHHRVKNNLETVSSLLELQSAQLTDAKSQSVMQASQSRVQSMGLIHQKLYQGENLANIEMREYFKNLSDSILDTFDAWNKVNIEIAMQPLELDVDTAVPIGLIVNELLTNALKYAFPDHISRKGKGNVNILLEKPKARQLRLVVSDDGIGKSEHTKAKGTGFGSQLVNLLTQQLRGSMEVIVKEGTSFIFHFRKM